MHTDSTINSIKGILYNMPNYVEAVEYDNLSPECLISVIKHINVAKGQAMGLPSAGTPPNHNDFYLDTEPDSSLRHWLEKAVNQALTADQISKKPRF